jgi:hypothetical protein
MERLVRGRAQGREFDNQPHKIPPHPTLRRLSLKCSGLAHECDATRLGNAFNNRSRGS